MTAGMPALRWHGRGDVRLDRVPVPEPGRGQILVEVERTGICGTDLDEYVRGPLDVAGPPVTLGHEVVGTVAAGGDLEPGTRVVPDVVLGCGECWWCRRHEPGLCPRLKVRGLQTDGGLARYMLAETATAVPVPEHVPAETAAFAEPLSVAVRALRKAGDLAGRTVAVVGAGTIGLLVTALATARGALCVVAVEPAAARRALAARYGAVPVSPGEAAQAVGDRGADVTVECSGADAAVWSAVELTRPGGTVVLVGTGATAIALPVRSLVLEEKRVLGSAAHVWDVDVTGAVALLAAGVVDPAPLLTAVVPLTDAVDGGFERLRRDPATMKIQIDARK
ncbi:zinc-binding dehydrogenase [Nonomuraea sp. KC401]|uniref:zinc-dependent alcohol dehydrogenase n=1 Tax=unclassified Nonomuraea TaxID=2593643 RepID=UPI0010FE22EF|nr:MULTISPECIES: alcohol dehydrogenase catalytic domain-containing protein [unclassified Nonomuraea]NBE93377.1 alcohol dehydrogenase catalytic domain-containing protein [Nonomuraea sp. K271]TLF62669.1 zinc-binding dehydrogenase [Nonomuraea sp. KC401]